MHNFSPEHIHHSLLFQQAKFVEYKLASEDFLYNSVNVKVPRKLADKFTN